MEDLNSQAVHERTSVALSKMIRALATSPCFS